MKKRKRWTEKTDQFDKENKTVKKSYLDHCEVRKIINMLSFTHSVKLNRWNELFEWLTCVIIHRSEWTRFIYIYESPDTQTHTHAHIDIYICIFPFHMFEELFLFYFCFCLNNVVKKLICKFNYFFEFND